MNEQDHNVLKRLLSRVRLPDDPFAQPADSFCWIWTGSKNQYGYGHIRVGVKAEGTRRLMYAHRAMYEVWGGRTLADGEVVRHRCDNPSCISPHHLESGSRGENLKDAYDRGRRGGSRTETPEAAWTAPTA